MARIALLDRDRDQHARGADLVRPDLGDIRHAGAAQLLLEHRRTHDRAIARHLIRAAADRRHAENDRIVAVIDRFDLEYGLRALIGGVIARPFTERSFEFTIVVVQKTFENNFRIGWKRQPGDFAAHAFDRFAAHAADNVVFADAVWMLGARHK